MKIYIFEAKNESGMYGYSNLEDGNNLPVTLNNKTIIWSYKKILDVQENDTRPYIGLDIVECINSIKKQGWYINKISIDTTIQPS